MQNVSDLMKRLDLGMDGIAVKDVITFSSMNDLPVSCNAKISDSSTKLTSCVNTNI